MAATAVTDTALLPRLRRSLAAAAGTVVFGMEDGTVSIFGLVFGVAATTDSNVAVLVAGASGAAAAAVSMMAGAYLETETDRDEAKARQNQFEIDLRCDPGGIDQMLAERLDTVELEKPLAEALAGAVRSNPTAIKGLLQAIQGGKEAENNPTEQALWMLVADFFSAAVPIVPFMLMPVAPARWVSGAITILLLAGLGIGRALIAKGKIIHTVIETVGVGIVAALAGVGIGVLFNNTYGGG